MRDAVREQGCSCPAFRDPIALFHVELATGAVQILPDTLSPSARERLVTILVARSRAENRPPSGMLTVAAGEIVERPVAIGYMISESDEDLPSEVFGFVVDVAGLGDLFREWYEDRRLLPAPIAGDEPNDSILYVTVEGAGEMTVFASPIPYPTTLAASSPVGTRFDDLVIHAAVRPDAASRLIIGGLPNSRLPLLAALLALTLGVGVAAVVQLRREQEFQRLRDDFVSGVSHELRTPLAQIRMFAELQEAGKLRSPDDQSRAVRVIHRESKRLSHLVENILQFSRLRRTQGQGMPMESLDLAEAMAEGIDAVTPLVQDRGIRLRVEAEEGLEVVASRDALTRIVVNLLDNAAKYGPAGQTIELQAARRNGSVRLSVSDEGPGVPIADRERVWKAYRRLERDVKARVPGSGIGLAVVSQLAAFHGGRAWVEEAESGGARFVVEFPLAPSHAGVREAP
jgi:signal transduction histidine kinase